MALSFAAHQLLIPGDENQQERLGVVVESGAEGEMLQGWKRRLRSLEPKWCAPLELEPTRKQAMGLTVQTGPILDPLGLGVRKRTRRSVIIRIPIGDYCS